MTTKTDENEEYPPIRFTFAWRGVLLRIIGYAEEGKPESRELAELLAKYLEQSSLTPNEFIDWAKTQEVKTDG